MVNVNILLILLFASVAVSLSVVSISIVVLILLNKNSTIKGLGYLVGWVAGLIVIAGMSYYFLDTFLQIYQTPTLSSHEIEKILMGLIFILVSIKIWHSRPKNTDEIPHSRIFDEVEKLNFIKASLLAFVLQITNLKNITLVFFVTYMVLSIDLQVTIEIILILLFIIISSFTLIVPLLFIAIMGDRIKPTLQKIKTWLLINNKAILAVMIFVSGVFMVIENLISYLH